MKISAKFRFLITLIMLFSLLSPTAVFAIGDGKKHFKQGMKHEVAEEWDKAVEEFAFAVADNPKNPEYRLHYIRSLFFASQQYMEKGTKLAEEKDYEGAYIAFRKAYAYDPVNGLAKSEMDRMLRLQKALVNGDDNPDGSDSDVKLVKTSAKDNQIPDDVVIPQRYEVLRNITHPNPFPIMTLIRELADSLDLNVLFDSASRLDNQKITIQLKNVTSAQALDAIFLQENLFFEKVGPRTILVASSTRRQFFQQLVIKTFYLENADPKDVSALISKAIPAQPGRTPTIVLTDEDTNSITIRDTAENIRLMSKLIKSLDKDRAEVVMDVQIYEILKQDILQIGNQIGNSSSLINLGGTTRGAVGTGGNDIFGILTGVPTAFGTGILLPASTLAAYQKKSDTKLIASTQIHAFNNEDSSARIGQRVPVRTATFQTGGTNNTGNGVVADVINYEQTGLTLKFKPIVFPNQDVQVTMEIESKSVIGGSFDNPIFSERTIKGTARIQNNKSLLLASVAQGTETKGREGIPFLGLIPILGRFFTAPTKDNSQTDIVIAVTPRVIRAPAILPEDLEERDSGTLATPTGSSLQAMLLREEVERQQNLAKLEKQNKIVQLPDAPPYVKSTGDDVSSNQPKDKVENPIDNPNSNVPESPTTKTDNIATNVRPIDSGVRTLDLEKTLNSNSDSTDNTVAVKEISLTGNNFVSTAKPNENTPTATLQMMPKFSAMKAGQKTKIAVMVRSGMAFRSAVLGLRFDETKVAVRSVGYGEVFGADIAQTLAKPFINQGGKMYVSLASPKDTAQNSSGIIAYIEIESLIDGTPEMTFEADMLSILTADGNNFVITF